MAVQFVKKNGIKEQVLAAYANSYTNKVKAIKLYRKLTNSSLKEAKDTVEAWVDGATIEATVYPDNITVSSSVDASDVPFSHPTNKKYSDVDAIPCKLSEAKNLHRPVKGTDSSSIYHVIALNDKCVVAARIKTSNQVAIRAVCTAEDPTTRKKIHSKFAYAGLDAKNGGHYSIHLHPNNFKQVKQTIGSILFTMAGDFTQISDRLEILIGEGK